MDADPVPTRIPILYLACQGYRCNEPATWRRWAGHYCCSHAIRAGWLPGPVQRPGDQLVIQ